jgi:hypothetical protein
MQLTLSPEESRQLLRHLTQRVEQMQAELVHTDQREFRHELVEELQSLQALTEKIRYADAARFDGEPSVHVF